MRVALATQTPIDLVCWMRPLAIGERAHRFSAYPAFQKALSEQVLSSTWPSPLMGPCLCLSQCNRLVPGLAVDDPLMGALPQFPGATDEACVDRVEEDFPHRVMAPEASSLGGGHPLGFKISGDVRVAL